MLTPEQYEQATRDVKELQSLLVQRRLQLLRDALYKLDTATGKIEAKRRAHVTAAAYKRTIVIAERVALDELRNPYENAELGRQRLLAATDEATRKLTKQLKDITAARYDDYEPTPDIEHGLRAYRRKLCKCDICRAANAAEARAARLRKAIEHHNAEQRTSETTDTRSATRRSSSDSAAA